MKPILTALAVALAVFAATSVELKPLHAGVVDASFGCANDSHGYPFCFGSMRLFADSSDPDDHAEFKRLYSGGSVSYVFNAHHAGVDYQCTIPVSSTTPNEWQRTFDLAMNHVSWFRVSMNGILCTSIQLRNTSAVVP